MDLSDSSAIERDWDHERVIDLIEWVVEGCIEIASISLHVSVGTSSPKRMRVVG